MISDDIMQKLIFGNGNKVKLLRENRQLSLEQLAELTKLDEEDLKIIESRPIKLLTPELEKIALALDIDEELLLDIPYDLENKDIYLLDKIIKQVQQTEDFETLKTQIINWANFVIQKNRQSWADIHADTIEAVGSAYQKNILRKNGLVRDNKYAPFREYFKQQQKIKFEELKNKGETLTARCFAKWFLENEPKNFRIPYVTQNRFNKLTQLAIQNNKEFIAT